MTIAAAIEDEIKRDPRIDPPARIVVRKAPRRDPDKTVEIPVEYLEQLRRASR